MQTVALGVDGMELSLCDRWIDEGELEQIREIRESGAYGTAECSSLISAKQWTTHFTGVDSAVHGVEGFLRQEEVEHKRDEQPQTRISPDNSKLINLGDIRCKTYPELLDESGESVGLVNPLPIWPPLELESGFCIAGLVTPPETELYTHPECIKQELEDIGYRIDVQCGNRPYGFIDDLLFSEDEVSLHELQKNMFDVLDKRIEFTKRVVENDEVDFLYSLLKTVDIIQHTFWAHMEADDSQYGDNILKCYRQVDELIGWIRNRHPEVNIVVFGDHGFGPRRDPRSNIVHSLGYLMDTYFPIPYYVKQAYRNYLKAKSSVDLGSLDGITGDHSNPTACMMAGPDVREATLDIAFEDITPTLLALHNQAIPSQYIGTPPSDAISCSVELDDISLEVSRDMRDVADEVSERLYNLGYAEMVEGS